MSAPGFDEFDEDETPFVYGDETNNVHQSLQSKPNIPPGYDGRQYWFTYDEAIDDWCDMCTLDDANKRPFP